MNTFVKVADEGNLTRAAKRLQKEKAEFMRIIVHELRSPVAASKSLVSARQYTNREEPSLMSVLARIEKRMDQLLDLVKDMKKHLK